MQRTGHRRRIAGHVTRPATRLAGFGPLKFRSPMNDVAIPAAAAPPAARAAPLSPAWLSSRALLAWWGLSLVLLLAFLGNPPVQRTQEARVLETAREILNGDRRR